MEFKTQEIISAGMGGQGVLKAGLILAEVAMKAGYHVSWMPSYGPEMRGGTAHCKVVISDRPVGSPIVANPNVVLAFNRPSMEKFEKLMKPGGLLIINESLVEVEPTRNDLEIVKVPASKLADELGNTKATNMVMIGAYVKKTGYLKLDEVIEQIKETFKGKPEKVIDINIKAIKAGFDAV